MRAHGVKNKILSDFFKTKIDDIIINWLKIEAEFKNNCVKYDFQFLPNEITNEQNGECVEVHVEYDHELMKGIIRHLRKQD